MVIILAFLWYGFYSEIESLREGARGMTSIYLKKINLFRFSWQGCSVHKQLCKEAYRIDSSVLS